MELLNSFRETIFLKENSNLEIQVNELKKIRNNLINKETIDKDIKCLEIGLEGEKEIAFELKNANLGMYVLHDVTLTHEDLKAQIDYIIITKAYCYLVECKNLIGNITVNEMGEFKREYTLNGKKIKEAIYSPYTQVIRHKDVLKKQWLKKQNKITTFLFENAFDKFYKPLVVLSNAKSLLNTRFAPLEIQKSVIRVDQLVQYIKNDINNYDHDKYLSKKNMLELANSLLEKNVNYNNNFTDKYKDLLENDAVLEEKLRNFRKEKSSKMNVPAYFIFTDNEMQKMIEKKPKTIIELKELNILSQVKLNIHAKEIISIINHEE